MTQQEQERMAVLVAWLKEKGWQLGLSVRTPVGELIDVANFTTWPVVIRLSEAEQAGEPRNDANN